MIGRINKIVMMSAIVLGMVSCDDILSSLDNGDPREKLADTWKVEEDNGYYKSAKEIYWVDIDKHPTDSARILIFNFFNLDKDTPAEALLNKQSLILPQQVLPGNYTVSGTGIVSNSWNVVTWTYNVDDGSGMINQVTAIYTRLEF